MESITPMKSQELQRSQQHYEEGQELDTVFARVICALFFPNLTAEKSGCVKYADFSVEVLIWVLF